MVTVYCRSLDGSPSVKVTEATDHRKDHDRICAGMIVASCNNTRILMRICNCNAGAKRRSKSNERRVSVPLELGLSTAGISGSFALYSVSNDKTTCKLSRCSCTHETSWSRCIPVDYYSRFVTNTVIVPAVLLALVTATYAMGKTPTPSVESLSPSELARRIQERRTRQKSDYYFAFFLVCECSRIWSFIVEFCWSVLSLTCILQILPCLRPFSIM